MLFTTSWILRKGHVFISISHSVHGGRGVWQTPPWADAPPPRRRPLQRMVPILLECILVLTFGANFLQKILNISSTRMHSSRMRTGRALTDCIVVWGGVPGTHPLLATHTPLPCTPLRHACPPFTTHAPPLPCMPHFATHAPPPVNRITDRCKNITLATTSLRPVITQVQKKAVHRALLRPIDHKRFTVTVANAPCEHPAVKTT